MGCGLVDFISTHKGGKGTWLSVFYLVVFTSNYSSLFLLYGRFEIFSSVCIWIDFAQKNIILLCSLITFGNIIAGSINLKIYMQAFFFDLKLIKEIPFFQIYLKIFMRR